MNHSDCEGGENEKHKLASQGPPHQTGYVHLGIPLAAVIARLRGRTLVKVLAAHRERDESDQR